LFHSWQSAFSIAGILGLDRSCKSGWTAGASALQLLAERNCLKDEGLKVLRMSVLLNQILQVNKVGVSKLSEESLLLIASWRTYFSNSRMAKM
jgi:hypothetical protein